MRNTNEFGYREELNRSMGAFSSFAISFSLISVLTGLFANFTFGYQHAGGAVLWLWLLVAAGQFLVALVMANLSIRFPIAGYGYQWAARLVTTDFGFFIGWLLFLQLVTGFPGICQTFTVTLLGIIGIAGNHSAVVAGSIVIISIVSFLHWFGIKYSSKVNDWGVYAELFGVLLFIFFLVVAWFWSGTRPANALPLSAQDFSIFTRPFSSLVLSLLVGAWCLTGFEAAADLAEETKSPGRNVPRAIVFSHVISSISGLVILFLLLLHLGGGRKVTEGQPLILAILEQTIGPRFTLVLLLFILLSIFACAVAAMATASRLLFSLSRDQILPYSSWISTVEKNTQAPRNAILLIWAVSILAILFFKKIEIITNVSALASYLAYAGIMLATLFNRKPSSKAPFLYSLKMEKPIQVLAFVWTLVVVAALAVPESTIEGYATKHMPALSTALGLLAGVLLYFFYVRKKIRSGTAGPPNIFNS